MGGARFAVVSVLAAIAVSSCSLLVSLDGLSDGGAAADASAIDANLSDAIVVGADSALNPDGSALLDGGPFCADGGGFLHCDNFDDDASITTRNPISQYGVVELDTTIVLSPPNVLHVVQDTFDAGTSAGNFITWNATSEPNFIRVNFDFFTQDQPPAGKSVEMARIHITGIGWLDFVPSLTTIAMNEVNESDGNTFPGPVANFAPQDGNWHHLEMVLDMTGTVSKMSMTIDSTVVSTPTQTTLTWNTGTTSVILGTRGQTAPGTSVHGRYDNFTVASQ